MSSRRVVSVGNRRDFPRELWGPADHEAELDSAAAEIAEGLAGTSG